MKFISITLLTLLFFLMNDLGCATAGHSDAAPPESFLLYWQNDPTTTMTIDWYPDREAVTYMEHRKKGETEWQLEMGERYDVPDYYRYLMRVELTGLQPDQLYEFRFSGEEPVYRFHTMPRVMNRPIRFVAGGDMMHHRSWMRRTARSVMETAGEDLDFAVIGGDLPYADAEARKAFRWFDYFRVWSEEMVTSEGRVIPHLAAIGNHEVREMYIHNYPAEVYNRPEFRREEAPYFTTFIPFPGDQGYGVLDFGDYLSLFLLDSNHTSFVDEEQTDWLELKLYERQHVRHIIPVYHVAGWPSVRDMLGYVETLIRENWVPLFEEYGVRLAFENHDHAYKRTHPIRNYEIDETGVYYIGDGAWGVRTRTPRTDEEGNLPWYIAQADSVRHFIITEIDGDEYHLRMYDEDGRQIDMLDIEPAN